MSQDQPRRSATVLESIDDLRAQLRRGQTQAIEMPLAPARATPAAGFPAPAAVVDDSATFRPSHRPPMALLTIFDDGEEEGESIRLREARYQIGRGEGSVLIPHDPALSGRHAEISRRVVDGVYRWYLRDLGSSNGTFVRVARTPLQPSQELILGGRRYRFDLVSSAPAAASPEPTGLEGATQKWQAMRPGEGPGSATAALVEVNDVGDGRRFPLAGSEQWLGRDPRQCGIAIADPMLSPRHARLTRDAAGRWHVENARSKNGVWLRVDEIAIDRNCHFLCGEQRFLVRVF